MKIKFQTKYTTISAYVVLTFMVCVLFCILVFKFSILQVYFSKFMHVFSPMVWGIAMAYLLNPLMNFFEPWVRKVTERKQPHPRMSRIISIIMVLLVLALVITALIAMIVPEIVHSIKNIINNLPFYLNNVQKYLQTTFQRMNNDNPDVLEFVNSQVANIEDLLLSIAEKVQPQMDNLFDKDGLIMSLTGSAFSMVVGLKNFFIGLIIAVYFLFDKEHFQAQIKKLIYAICKPTIRKRILKLGSETHEKFIHFLVGKSIDSFIIGVIAFFALNIMKMPYATLISLLVGITNMIPFFGPLIGAVPAAVLILIAEPRKELLFIIFILILQTFDGNILGPKILGNQLGMSTFWILFAIVIGGGFFGFVGMLFAVPCFAVLYPIVKGLIDEKLHSRRLPTDTETYYKAYIPEEEDTSEPVTVILKEDA